MFIVLLGPGVMMFPRLSPARMREVCTALALATACPGGARPPV